MSEFVTETIACAPSRLLCNGYECLLNCINYGTRVTLGREVIESFLEMLANERGGASTHNQALSALLFIYREVAAVDLPWLSGIQRPRTPKRLPSVLTVAEVAVPLSALSPGDGAAGTCSVGHRHAFDGGDASAHQRRGF